MQLSIDNEDCEHYPFPDSNVLSRIFENEIASLWPQGIQKPEIVEISISTLTQSDMKEQNKMFRGIDSSTDALSFPMWENNGEFAPEMSCPMLLLGDILLCPEKISENAAAKLESKEYFEELCLVLAHSFLHLLCWDHGTEENETNMWRRQETIKSRIIGEQV
ncbi:MAG: rRNA maturation RNase YbeY [Synergistaceae bacterium]|nr:rRNA maturation RNase YbeY [Synergistaceae bacterium]